MEIYTQRFDVRWSDLDANRHVANSAYLNFMSHTRMAYLISQGFGHEEMNNLNIGPVIFHEHIYYFREVLPGSTIFVTMELQGLSKDNMFFEFVHNIYAKDGTHHLRAELMGAFIDLQSRKLTPLPEKLIKEIFEDLNRTEDFRWITKEDTRAHQRRPVHRTNGFP